MSKNKSRDNKVLWRSGSAPFLYDSSLIHMASSGYADAVGSNPTRTILIFVYLFFFGTKLGASNAS